MLNCIRHAGLPVIYLRYNETIQVSFQIVDGFLKTPFSRPLGSPLPPEIAWADLKVKGFLRFHHSSVTPFQPQNPSQCLTGWL